MERNKFKLVKLITIPIAKLCELNSPNIRKESADELFKKLKKEIEEGKISDIVNIHRIMSKEEKYAITKIQLSSMVKDIEETLFEKLDKALNSGCLPEDYIEDNYLLAKAIIDSFCKDRPYSAASTQTQKEFDNIHKFI